MRIVDATGNAIGGQRLKSSVGYPATAEGYFYRGTLYAVILQVDAMPQLEHGDSAVRIHKAAGRDRSGQLRVMGTTDLLWVNSKVRIVDSVTGKVLATRRVIKRRGRDHGRFLVDINALERVPSFVFARIDGDEETVRSRNKLVAQSSISLLPAAEEFALEGPIEHLDAAERTITVNGVIVRIPSALSIGGTNDIRGDTLERLADAETNPAKRSVMPSDCNSGYLVRIRGRVSREETERPTAGTSRFKAVYTATACSMETEEVELTGTLESIDPQARQLTVNGLTVLFNEDERFGFAFHDGAGLELSSELVSEQRDQLVGSQVTVKGYSHIFRAKAVGTEYRPVQANIFAVNVDFLPTETVSVSTRTVDAE
jgi:hypothetical protein